MNNKEFAKKLEKRTRIFAVKIIQLSAKLPNTHEGRVVKTQITKAGTSVGANYREANRARSKADFSKSPMDKNKIKICESEASETQYWLEIILEVKWLTEEEMKFEIDECAELLGIFTSTGNKLSK